MIPINKPLIGEKEIEAVVKVLRSGTLTSRTTVASNVGRFEKAFAEFVEAKYAFAVNSGTAALHLSLLASGTGRGSEVVVPSFTFVSTAEAVILAGAKPVFVDIDPDTFNIDSEKIEESITKETKAVIPVDLFGLPADMKPIRELAERHGLVVIEDAAQAHGARYAGRHAGSFADLACWSFYASKNMTTGEGGMVTTNTDEYCEKLPYMRSHGERDEYVSNMIGGNFRMPEIQAAIGNVQLTKLPNFLKVRQRNAEMLSERLGSVRDLELQKVPEGYTHSWYLFTVRLKNASEAKRNKVVDDLRKLGIGATVYYPVPIHEMPFYRDLSRHRLPNSEEAAKQVFSLPVHPDVSTKDIDYIANSVKKLLS